MEILKSNRHFEVTAHCMKYVHHCQHYRLEMLSWMLMNCWKYLRQLWHLVGFKERRREGKEKKERMVCEGVDETKPTGYKTLSIILFKLQECKAWNKITQITHHSVWYINSHFRTQTKREKKKTCLPLKMGFLAVNVKLFMVCATFRPWNIRSAPFFPLSFSWQTVKATSSRTVSQD